MTIPIIPALATCLLISLALYRYIIYPASISPLSKIPSAHWSAPFSSLWILYHRSHEAETPTVHAAHQRLGPIIRIAPNDISVNSVDGGIRTVYAGGYEKGDWYRNVFENYGVMPMFAMPDHGPHSKRKRMVSNIYAKSTLQNSAALTAITKVLICDRLMPRLRAIAQGGEPVEFYWLFTSITLDFVSAYIFGLEQGSNYVQHPELGSQFFANYKARQRYQFWPQDLPHFTAWMTMLGLKQLIVPKWVDQANREIEAWVLRMCDEAEKIVAAKDAGEEGGNGMVEDWPTVYAQLRTALLKEEMSKSDLDVSVEDLAAKHRLTMASEMLDHTLAGFDTSSITLTFLAWELSRPQHSQWQQRLHNEIAGLEGDLDAKTIDALPTLQAILMESLRLHAAIPGNQPRVTPPAATLGAPGYEFTDLPPGVRVQAQAWSLHRNPEVFPEPEVWKPERWLPEGYASKELYEAAQKEMSRWFWAFGSGGRMCVGSNLAMYDMKAIIVGIWGRFKTVVVEDAGMVHRGGYVAEPVGKDGKVLMLSVEEL